MYTKDNNISIRSYLAEKGIYPEKDRGYYGMYHSPFREDHNASMKVDFNQNVWIDYGTGEGGGIIKLIEKLENISEDEAKRQLKERTSDISFSFHNTNSTIQPKERQTIQIKSINNLSHPALLSYLNERGIDPVIAKSYLVEVNYSINNKPYYAIGFKNKSGGYELRNKYFKGCIKPKDISLISHQGKTCSVFEGFMDFLSYLTLKGESHPNLTSKEPEDYLILNSVLSLSKALEPLKGYQSITCYLDTDTAGKTALNDLKKHLPNVSDGSIFYKDHKDINEYLCKEKISRLKEKNNLSRLPKIPIRKQDGRRRLR